MDFQDDPLPGASGKAKVNSKAGRLDLCGLFPFRPSGEIWPAVFDYVLASVKIREGEAGTEKPVLKSQQLTSRRLV